MPDKAHRNTQRKNDKTDTLKEEEVVSFLESHPSFFQDRDHLIEKMELPHEKGQAISLVERQVAILRQRNIDARLQIDQLVHAASHNSRIFEHCRKLILSLISAETADQMFERMERSFSEDFKSNAYYLLLFATNRQDEGEENVKQLNHYTSLVSPDTLEPQIRQIIAAKEPQLGVLRDELKDLLFHHQAMVVNSAAVIPVTAGNGDCLGILSIGSKDPRYFEAGMGTIFLQFITDTLASLLPRHISLQDDEQRD